MTTYRTITMQDELAKHELEPIEFIAQCIRGYIDDAISHAIALAMLNSLERQGCDELLIGEDDIKVVITS